VHRIPEHIVADFIVAVAQAIPHARDEFPLTAWIAFAQMLGQSLDRFAHDFHDPLEGEQRDPV
jgi:hypothetical protein